MIIGGGPAASAMAIGLGGRGCEALIIERGDDRGDKIGETLPPNAKPLFDSLGIDLDAGPHLRSYGTRSAWGSADIATNDFINNPYGHGWHLDRRGFETELIERATSLGATRWAGCGAPSVERDSTDWTISLEDGSTITTPQVVDATGRAAWLARRRGASRQLEDPAIAVVGFLRTTQSPDPSAFAFVESVPSGWWYSATLPNNRMATAYVTHPELLDRTMRDPTRWRGFLDLAPNTRARIEAYGYKPDGDIVIRGATGGILDPLFGDGWLAIGDAAVAFDPLSSHGITAALVGGLAAAEALLARDEQALTGYAAKVERNYATYRTMRRQYYLAEQRWPEEPFWRYAHT